MIIIPDITNINPKSLKLFVDSIPIINLNSEEIFVDNKGFTYGSKLRCRFIGQRDVTKYIGNPIVNQEKDVIITYDHEKTANGLCLLKEEAKLESRVEYVSRREYVEVLVTVDEPDKEYNEEFRILMVEGRKSRSSLFNALGGFFGIAIKNLPNKSILIASSSSHFSEGTLWSFTSYKQKTENFYSLDLPSNNKEVFPVKVREKWAEFF